MTMRPCPAQLRSIVDMFTAVEDSAVTDRLHCDCIVVGLARGHSSRALGSATRCPRCGSLATSRDASNAMCSTAGSGGRELPCSWQPSPNALALTRASKCKWMTRLLRVSRQLPLLLSGVVPVRVPLGIHTALRCLHACCRRAHSQCRR